MCVCVCVWLGGSGRAIASLTPQRGGPKLPQRSDPPQRKVVSQMGLCVNCGPLPGVTVRVSSRFGAVGLRTHPLFAEYQTNAGSMAQPEPRPWWPCSRMQAPCGCTFRPGLPLPPLPALPSPRQPCPTPPGTKPGGGGGLRGGSAGPGALPGTRHPGSGGGGGRTMPRWPWRGS